MPDDKKQGLVTQFLHSLGALTWPTVDAHYIYDPKKKRTVLVKPKRSKADTVVGLNGHFFAVETKNQISSDGNNFPFANWEDHQRDWADTYCHGLAKCDYWIALVMGKDRVNATHPDARPTRFWLVPRIEFLKVEDQLAPQKSLPYNALDARRLEVRHNALDAVNLLSAFEIIWYPKATIPVYTPPDHIPIKSAWRLPLSHPAYRMYVQTRNLLYEETCHDPAAAETGTGQLALPLAPTGT